LDKEVAKEIAAAAAKTEAPDDEGNEQDLFYYPPGLTLTDPHAGRRLKALQAESSFKAFSDYQTEFEAFMADLNLRYFKASEFLYLGGGHHAPGGCKGKNRVPAKGRWAKIRATAQVLDEIRHRLDAPVLLNSIYRNQPYNTCIGGVSGSLHMQFNAADFRCTDGKPSGHWAAIAHKLRDEGFFKGGIGIYNTFVHVDTRGVNKSWDKR
jgi:hypothetical protein